jgi:hypothetical protein
MPNETPIPISTSTISIETLSADPNYMSGCKEINPNSVSRQASYKGIYPGQTTLDEVRNVLGKPLRTYDLTDISWEYDNLAVVFDESIVIGLYVDGDNATLKDLILRYGCPDAIYAVDIYEHPSGAFSRLLFLYPDIGFDFAIDNIPAKLNDTIYQMDYFLPGTLEDYKKRSFSLTIANASKPMTWDEAVH